MAEFDLGLFDPVGNGFGIVFSQEAFAFLAPQYKERGRKSIRDHGAVRMHDSNGHKIV